MNQSDDVWRALSSLMQIASEQAKFAASTHARLVVLRKAIAALHQNPVVAEDEIRKLEEKAEEIVLSGEGFPESDAVVQLMKAGKKLGDFDS